MKKMHIIFLCILLYIYYKPSIHLIKDPDIILSPGGLLGFYVLGICHYIKNHYDIQYKKIIGFSAGSLNTLFLSLDKKYDILFLSELFKLNLHGTMQLPKLLKDTIDLMNKQFSIDQFNIKDKYIAVTSNYNRLDGYNTFLNVSDMTKCCISSSFIPFVTYRELFYFYHGKCSVDGGLLYNIYKKKVKHRKILWLNYKLFKRYNKFNIPGYSLLNRSCSIYDLYILGYKDSIENKHILDRYLLL
jgi:hypothetical protein